MSGNLFVISGPSGVGKDTLVALIFKQVPSLLRWVTATTRQPREGEVDGINYFFKSKEQFNSMIANGQLVEWNEFAGNMYGTPKQFVDDHVCLGHNILTTIDVNGAINIKKNYPDIAKLIFIKPPSYEELKRRLIARNTESENQVNMRLNMVKSELKCCEHFDRCFVNDNLETTCSEIVNYINNIIIL